MAELMTELLLKGNDALVCDILQQTRDNTSTYFGMNWCYVWHMLVPSHTTIPYGM